MLIFRLIDISCKHDFNKRDKSKMQITKVVSSLCDFHKSLCLLNIVLHCYVYTDMRLCNACDKNREHFSVACVALFTRTCVNFLLFPLILTWFFLTDECAIKPSKKTI